MKLQSTIFFSIIVFLSTTCSDKKENIPPFLTIDTKTVIFNSNSSIREVTVKTSLDDWSATVLSDANSWVEAIRRGSTLRIVVDENSELISRTAEIKVIAGDLFEIISLEQLGTEPAILLSSDIFTLSADGGDISFEVTSNVEYDVIIPSEVTWLKVMTEIRSGEMMTEEYRFKVDWNKDEAERRAEITVSQKEGILEKRIPVIQNGQNGYSGGSADDIKGDIKVPISSATASSYQYGEEIEKSFDNDYSTYYHSNWDNGGSNYFPITIDYYFSDQESIDYFVYYPRGDGGTNGHFKEVEIWVSTESNPNLERLSVYDFKGNGSVTKIEFEQPLVKPQVIRFIVQSGAGSGQGFASCAEMEFYRKNPDSFDPLQLFTDLTCSQLKPGITLDDIERVSNNLYRNIAFYLHNGQYPREFRIQEYRAWPHPNEWAKKNKTSPLSLLDNPTGISVSTDEELIVFVGDTYGYTLKIKVQNLDKPGGDGYDNASYYPLVTGVNKVKMQNSGLIYIFYHTPDYLTAPPVKIHFATGKVNGYFDSQKHTSSDWSRLLHNATNKHFDLLGQYAHLTFETEAFKSFAASDGPQLLDAYDDLVRLEQEFMGLMKYNRPTVNRAYFCVVYTSYMFATSYRTGYESGTQKNILSLQRFISDPWGPSHEMGHIFQTRPGFKWQGMTEVTNNVHSLYVLTQWGNPSLIDVEQKGNYNNQYEKAYHSAFVHKTPHPAESDVFSKLVSLWQLQLYFANAKGFTDLYKDFYEKVRISPDKPNSGEQQLDFVRMMCDITGIDLTGFFALWGYLTPYDNIINDYGEERFLITQNQIDLLISEIKDKNYAPMTEKIEYVCDSNWELFKNKLPVQAGSATKNGLNIKTNGWKNVVAYEVFDGEQLIFVTNRPSFTIDREPQLLKIYAVAYDGSKTEVKW